MSEYNYMAIYTHDQLIQAHKFYCLGTSKEARKLCEEIEKELVDRCLRDTEHLAGGDNLCN